MPAPATPEEVAAYMEAQRIEWCQYVATQTIYYEGCRVANVGDAIPLANVIAHGYVEAGVVELTPEGEIIQGE